MSWRDNLRDASYRGVPFKVLKISTDVGRRNILHQYPFKDEPYLEDMGQDADVYNVTGYIVQNKKNNFDYFNERNALIEVLKAPGPGILVHPWLGDITVGLQGKARMEESFTEGGIARFVIIFVLAGLSVSPAKITDYTEKVSKQADRVQDSMGTYVADVYNPDGPSYIKASALSTAQAGIDMLTNIITTISNTTKEITTLGGLRTKLETAVGLGTTLASTIKQAFASFSNILTAFESMGFILASLSLVDFGVSSDSSDVSIYGGTLVPVSETTDLRSREADNQELITNFYRVGGVAEACRAAATISYNSHVDIHNIMTLLVDEIDQLLNTMGSNPINDELYDSLRELKPLIIAALESKGSALPDVRNYTVANDIEPSLVIAYDLYKDINRESSITDRNKIIMLHPGFPPSGSVIEVLSE